MYLPENKPINFFVWALLACLLFSCAAKKQFQLASTLNTIQSYEDFLEEYSKSPQAIDAASRLRSLYESRDWGIAKNINSSSSYRNYLDTYPNGAFQVVANKYLKEAELKEKTQADWKAAQSRNSIDGYENFLKKYPNSEFSRKAMTAINGIIQGEWNKVKSSDDLGLLDEFAKKYPKTRQAELALEEINEIRDLSAWEIADEENSISSYNRYLSSSPRGNYAYTAKSRINKIEEERYVLPEWEKATTLNNYKAYKNFYSLYPNSSYANTAKSRMEMIESRDWRKANSSNSISGYKNYISNYPNTEMADIARKRIIDLEVENIFKGDYGYLPPMNKTSTFGYGQTRPKTNTIEIENDTRYVLTVWYSGNTSKKIILNPGQNSTFSLPNGSYKVAASVKASNVTNYAGNENLSGGSYESKFYIETRKGFNF